MSRDKSLKEKISILVKAVSVCIVTAAVVFVCLVAFERLMLQKYEKTDVVVSLCPLSEGTEITNENRQLYFGIKAVPKELAVDSVYKSLEELGTGVVRYEVGAGEIMYGGLSEKKDELTLFNEPVEVSFGVDDEECAVAGSLRAGDAVDIYIADRKSDVYGIILDDVILYRCFDERFAEILNDDMEKKAVNFTIILEREEVSDFLPALEDKKIRVVKKKG